MPALAEKHEIKSYDPLPTLRRFHESPAQIRAIVGPVGSGKTSAASLEIGYYLPWFLYERYGYKETRWCVIRNTYRELQDTTLKTVAEWFPDGQYVSKDDTLHIRYENGIHSALLFRSCDRPQDIKKFKSLEITGYWIDESIEVGDEIKRMLKNRIGRYPQKCPVRFGVETTNPPETEATTYWQFNWDEPPPGPKPERAPLPNHVGFWQPPYENEFNLRSGYYDDLRNDYLANPDWIDVYVEGKPGVIPTGKAVYNNFRRAYHEAKEGLIWDGQPLFRGWDNSGNIPAAVIVMFPDATKCHVLAEYHSDRMGIVDFAKWVSAECSQRWPNAQFSDWADPAGENKYSKAMGGFTSNAQLMRDCGVNVEPSEQNFMARKEAVEQQLRVYEGMLVDPSCNRLINGFLGGYCYPEIGTSGRYSDEPLKNRYSHVHDALQYVLVKTVKSQAKPIIKHRRKRPPSWRAA